MTRDEATRLLGLPPARLHKLWRRLGKLDDENLPAGATLFVLLADLLHRSSPLGPDETELVLDEYQADVVGFGDRLEKAITSRETELEVATLAVLDRGFATLSGRAELLSLETGRSLDKLDCVPVEVITYNLTALYVAGRKALEKRREAARTEKEARRAATGRTHS